MAASATCSLSVGSLFSGDYPSAVFLRRGASSAAFFCPRKGGALVTLRSSAVGSRAEAAPPRKPRGITKPKPVSPELQAVVGVKEIPRTQALKKIWEYIKENNLQDAEDKKIIVCDEKLKKIFGGKDRVGFLEIAGLLNPHFVK